MTGHWQRIHARRQHGYNLLRGGASIHDVARDLAVYPGTVLKWQRHLGLPSSHDREDHVRRRGMQLLQQGWSVAAVSAECAVALSAAGTWLNRVKAGEGPERRPRPTRLARLPPKEFLRLLAHSPMAFGFQGPTWTCEAISGMLRETCGIHHTPRTIQTYLKRRGIPWKDVNALRALYEAHP